MHTKFPTDRLRRLASALVLASTSAIAPLAFADNDNAYQSHNLVSDGFLPADHTDQNLVNAWGIAFNPTGPVWVANNGSGTSTLYNGSGTPLSLVVQIPTPSANTGGNPTGIVFNPVNAATSFPVSLNGGAPGGSRFIFATEDGVIAGWAPSVDGTHAIVAVDNSGANAIYKGLAISANGSGQLLYATDFHNARVDVFDNTWAPVTLAAGAFVDPKIPTGYAPFGIQAIGGNIFVTYAKQDADAHDDVHGPGLGFVDVYDPNGVMLDRVATHGRLNAPWGIALAPAGFGKFSNSLLIGNFGDGRVNAYDPKNYTPRGQLDGVQIDGLWGLAFGNGFAGQPVNTLFFTAGPGDEAHGLYGRIEATTQTKHSEDNQD
ncbi:MAG: TIGR03118 family protein [Gammaproteobacteria bacterium]|nr:MAG: TIGR03118 family protein [Gammaproteobacteria bacterium]